MKNIMFIAILAVGCAVMNRPSPRTVVEEAPKATEVLKPEPLPSVSVEIEPIVVTNGVLKPDLKYSAADLPAYEKYIPRVKKFFELMVNDKSILDGQVFEETTDTPDQIRSKIMGGLDIKIKGFRPKWYNELKWMYTIAYHEDWVIYINTKKTNRTDCAILNTLTHESTHGWSYSHRDDSPFGKEKTFPFWVGNKAEELCLAGKI